MNVREQNARERKALEPNDRRNPLAGRRIVLGVTGSISAYKAVAVASSLIQKQAVVDVVMTQEATRLIQPLTFQAITNRPVSIDMFDPLADVAIGHVSLAHTADLLLIAPATAHTIAKLALGLADDMVSTTALAMAGPCVLAPAMETNMWTNPATQAHVRTLNERGWHIIAPETGHLASGAQGEGRLAPPEKIVDVVKNLLSTNGDLGGLRLVITAGGTREPIDPVRYISNRSSGKMGHALAEAARDRGASVTLITCADLSVPEGVRAVRVERAADVREAVFAAWDSCDALVMAAAVADYRVAAPADQKIKKKQTRMVLDLEPTTDILGEAASRRGGSERPLLVGFAAETADLRDNARGKLHGKRLDLVVANDVSPESGVFGGDYNAVTLLRPDGEEIELARMPKLDVAHRIWDEVLRLHSKPVVPSLPLDMT